MSLSGFFLLVAFAASCAMFIAYPLLFGTATDSVEREDVKDNKSITHEQALGNERDAVLATIRDLDFDFRTGKLTADEYQAQRERLVQYGIDLLKSIDQLDTDDQRQFPPAP